MVTSDDRRRLGVLGLGNIGLPIARRLRAQGFDTVAYDRSPERMAEWGGPTASAPDELRAVGTLLVVTPTLGPAIHLLDASGAIPDVTVLLSTASPDDVRRIGRSPLVRRTRFIEAAISGGPERAESGDLALFLGGDKADIESAGRVLGAISSEAFHLGPLGAGATTKLAHQLVMFATAEAHYEALDLARAGDVDPDVARKAISAGLADSWIGRHPAFLPAIARDYDATGVPQDTRPWRKDLHMFMEAAASSGTAVGLSAYLESTVGDRIESDQEGTTP